MMAADYRHIGGRENRLGRHYSRFSAFWPAPTLAGQSLALRKLCDAGSNRRSRVRASNVPPGGLGTSPPPLATPPRPGRVPEDSSVAPSFPRAGLLGGGGG